MRPIWEVELHAWHGIRYEPRGNPFQILLIDILKYKEYKYI